LVCDCFLITSICNKKARICGPFVIRIGWIIAG
jgi:hypothetical protein